jgi:hypothetical protein
MHRATKARYRPAPTAHFFSDALPCCGPRTSLCDLTYRLASVRGRHCFVPWILNIGFQITRLPMHQGMAAVINFFAFIKGFAIWHERFLLDNAKAFNGFCARVYVSRMLTKNIREAVGI